MANFIIDTIKKNPVIALVPIGIIMIFILKKYNVDNIVYAGPNIQTMQDNIIPVIRTI